MNRLLLITLFLVFTKAAFAQTGKDSVVYNLPVVNGKLTYTDSVNVKGHSKAALDTTLKKWFLGYFKYYRPDTSAKNKDPKSSLLEQAILEFRMSTSSLGLVKYKFYLYISIKVDTRDNAYNYKISDIFFSPESGTFRAIGYYQSSPDYLIDLYKQKHLGLGPSINMGRPKIREYLTRTNDAIQACIASLNKAMTN